MRPGKKPIPPDERFWPNVQRGDGCWLWSGQINNYGYGRFFIGREAGRTVTVPAHSWAYKERFGRIAEGLVLDHLCRVRNCVNPDHLEPVTIGENVLRGEGIAARLARATQCVWGHPFDLINTYLTRNGERHCRACHAERERARRRRIRFEEHGVVGS